ncbi:MAG TPA: chemotaxis protein CheB [Coleofasciculaceae cyanobacterium]|jgi:two-component system chemotaxis response regulator CheB
MTASKKRLIDQTARMADFVVAIACSVGGLEALTEIVSALSVGFPGAIVIVQHLSPKYKSRLPEILMRHTNLAIEQAVEGAKLVEGSVYVAPAGYHLIINPNGTLGLSDAPKEHFVRPSAEYTFKSLANSYRTKAIGVVLTGYDSDGQEGVGLIKELGGKVIAQDQATSKAFSMPQSAIETGCVDLILPIEEIAAGIVNLVIAKS